MDIFKDLYNMDKNEIENAISKAKNFISTKEGKEALQKLMNGEKAENVPIEPEKAKKIVSELKKNPEILSKLTKIFNGKE